MKEGVMRIRCAVRSKIGGAACVIPALASSTVARSPSLSEHMKEWSLPHDSNPQFRESIQSLRRKRVNVGQDIFSLSRITVKIHKFSVLFGSDSELPGLPLCPWVYCLLNKLGGAADMCCSINYDLIFILLTTAPRYSLGCKPPQTWRLAVSRTLNCDSTCTHSRGRSSLSERKRKVF